MRTYVLQLTLSAAAAAAATPSAYAHSDVLVRSDGARVLIGAASDLDGEEGGPEFDLTTRVFEGVLLNPAAPTPPFGFDFERDEPGFYSQPGLAVGQDLPASAGLALALEPLTISSGTDSVFYWDGAGEVAFEPLSTAQPGVDFTFQPMAPAPFATTDALGAVDDHPLFGLTGGAADGVYLTQVRLAVDGLAPSEPFLMVWLASSVITTEELAESLEESLEAFEEGGPAPIVAGVDFTFFEEAVEFAEGIPEPSAAVLAAFALAAAARRARS
ncbi:hypothetical protein [Botrimarina sp.]|uniref:hypothetical protein n=1 Tax=Botrimarina sp. TaxID=2795802 RepID=UPI0032EFE41E